LEKITGMDFIDRRKVDVLVISDVHLGTVACNAAELLFYLKGISTKTLVLNGDFIDAWRFSRNYFPKSHLRVIRHIIKMMEKGTKVFYVTGNHDEIFRKFENTKSGKFKIVNQLVLNLDGKNTWFIHGDVFDSVVSKMKWLSKLGAAAYGFISVMNKILNLTTEPIMGRKINLFSKIKLNFKRRTRDMSKLEKQAANMAIKRKYQTVVCGHSHIPADKTIYTESGAARYLNSGDWVENNTALEYINGEWNLVYFTMPEKAGDNIQDDLAIAKPEEILQAAFYF
jgi:UDP-2,3-diacylglucosamine pyrophosphatase LpxH